MTDRIRVPRYKQQPTTQSGQQVTQTVGVRHTYGPPMPDFNKVDRGKKMDEFWCMTQYFNPMGFKSRFDNFLNFYNHIIGQCPNMIFIEVARQEDQFVLQDYVYEGHLVQIIDNSLIWQKERVFNMAVKWLPKTCTKIAWVDCDILCTDNDWAWKTSALLDDFVVVQPYFQNARLPITIQCIDYGVDINRFPYGFNDETRSDGDIHSVYKAQTGVRPWKHPGYLYAYRRELIEKHGFYDRCVAGSSDNMMSHAMINNYNSKAVILNGKYNTESLLHYWQWAIPVAEDVGGKIQFLRSNDVFHLYHGRTNNRGYLNRLDYLLDIGFDHGNDLVINEDTGLYELVPEKQFIKEWLSGYYRDRQDDEHRPSNTNWIPA